MSSNDNDQSETESSENVVEGSREPAGQHENHRGAAWPVTRRNTIRSGLGVGAFGLLPAVSNGGNGDPNGGQNGASGPTRSSLRVSLARKIARLDDDEELRLQLHTEPGRLDEAADVVRNAGGEIHAKYGTLIIADVRVAQIEGVANMPSVRLAGEYVPPEPHDVLDGTIREAAARAGLEVPDPDEPRTDAENGPLPTTEGVEITRADELHEQGITGDGVTIAIFDAFFDVTNEQYGDQVIATLGADPGDPGYEQAYENPGGHGDAVADIVAAMAPDAELVLGEVFSIPDFFFFDALAAVEENHPAVDVANFSVGFFMDFRIDGRDPISLRIDEFTSKTDAMFVNSAGNSAAVEEAWIWVGGGPVPIPLGLGDAYDSRGPGAFVQERGKRLLKFDEHFDADLPVSTRLPITAGLNVDVVVQSGFLGWTIVHWDADPDVDDQVYAARLFKHATAHQPLVVSRTRNPWETMDVLGEYFTDDVAITMDVQGGEWVVTDVTGEPEIAPIGPGTPTLTLPRGQRYTIENKAWPEHPLAFRHNVNGDSDVLLSQKAGVAGEFEDDPFVDWQDRGRRLAFTLTDGEPFLDDEPGLASLLNEYVSSADPDQTKGTVKTDPTPPIYVEVQRQKADEPHHFDVWAQFGGVNLPTPWATDPRTLGIPATSQDEDLVATGAVQAVDLGPGEGETRVAFERHAEDLKGYSSQGPTQDARRGLDLAAPSHVSTNARGPVEEVFGFNGTSAAAPHVTGGAGLLAEVTDDRAAIREALFAVERGINDPDVGAPGADNTKIGFGYLDVAAALAELTVESTAASAVLQPSR